MFGLKLAFAGLGPLVWHWGLGVGLIIILVAAAEFSTMIPVIGPWLDKVRKDLLWCAVAIALILVGEWIGKRDADIRCAAKAAVVEQTVDDVDANADVTHPRRQKWITDK